MSTYDNLQKDPLYRTVMAGMFGRWQKMLESEAFKAAFHPQGAEAAQPEGAQAAQAEAPKQNQNVPKQGQNVQQQGQNVPKQPSGPQAGF